MSCKDCQERKKFEDSFSQDIPYTERIHNSKLIRRFPKETPERLLKWHWDQEDRQVISLHQTDWKFQFDDELPEVISEPLIIPKGKYHRLIKGSDDLELEIIKL